MPDNPLIWFNWPIWVGSGAVMKKFNNSIWPSASTGMGPRPSGSRQRPRPRPELPRRDRDVCQTVRDETLECSRRDRDETFFWSRLYRDTWLYILAYPIAPILLAYPIVRHQRFCPMLNKRIIYIIYIYMHGICTSLCVPKWAVVWRPSQRSGPMIVFSLKK